MAAISGGSFFYRQRHRRGAMRRFIRGGEPVNQRLFIGVKGFDLIKGGLLRLFRRGEPVSQRLLIGVRALTCRGWPVSLFLPRPAGRQRLFVSVKRFRVEGGLLRLLCRGEPVCQRLLIGVKGLTPARTACFSFSAAAGSSCLSALRALLVKSGLLRLLRSGEANSQRLLIGVKGLNLLEDGLFLFFHHGQPGG